MRFEDLSLSPELTVARLLAFLGLAWTQRLDHFIRTHTATDTVEAKMEATTEARVSPRRQLPATPQPSKIPVRRESSLPSSGRSTPCSLPPPPHSAGARPGPAAGGLVL